MESLTIWCRLENGYWVLVRTRPAIAAHRLVVEYNDNNWMNPDRLYAVFPVGVNPNGAEVSA